ncbi:MAG: DUF4156 domain-containing protein [Pseudomonadota bacterium]
MRSVLVLFVTLTLAACTQVTLKPKGEQVKIGYAGNVQNCLYLGTVEASTQSKVVIERNAAAVQAELYILARNHAGSMGATNLLQHGEPEAGVQTFSAYDCPQLS